MGKLTISMAIFNSKLLNYQRVYHGIPMFHIQNVSQHFRKFRLKVYGFCIQLFKEIPSVISQSESAAYGIWVPMCRWTRVATIFQSTGPTNHQRFMPVRTAYQTRRHATRICHRKFASDMTLIYVLFTN
jgi:hypothetical protein